MKKNRLWIIVFVSTILFIGAYESYANQIEERFKNICRLLSKEFSETLSPAYKKYAASDEEREKTFARQRKLFKEWKEELRNLVELNPESIWADDAQYIISALSIEDLQQQTVELEYILNNYSGIHIEQWTKENLNYIFPTTITALEVRWYLCFNYKKLGNIDRLKYICEDSMKEFPEEAAKFKKFLKYTTSPIYKFLNDSWVKWVLEYKLVDKVISFLLRLFFAVIIISMLRQKSLNLRWFGIAVGIFFTLELLLPFGILYKTWRFIPYGNPAPNNWLRGFNILCMFSIYYLLPALSIMYLDKKLFKKKQNIVAEYIIKCAIFFVISIILLYIFAFTIWIPMWGC